MQRGYYWNWNCIGLSGAIIWALSRAPSPLPPPPTYIIAARLQKCASANSRDFVASRWYLGIKFQIIINVLHKSWVALQMNFFFTVSVFASTRAIARHRFSVPDVTMRLFNVNAREHPLKRETNPVSHRMRRHDSVSSLFRYFFAVLFIFQFLQFPSRRAKFRRGCESASGIPPAFLFVSFFLSLPPSFPSSFFRAAILFFATLEASAKTKRIPSRNKETSLGVKRLDRSLLCPSSP